MSSEITRKSIIITLIIIIIAFVLAFSYAVRAEEEGSPDPVQQEETLTNKQLIELQIVLVQEKMARLKAEYELAKRDLDALKAQYREEIKKETEAIGAREEDPEKDKKKD